MTGPGTSRRGFLAAAGALAASSAAAGAQPLPTELPGRFDRALVLSGGGARGAYEAGIIDYLRLSREIPDGQPLAPYGFVTGTSIGALNGYFVATAQYSKLRDLWYHIADQRILVPKPEYSKIRNADSGVLTRAVQTGLLIKELATNETGVVDGHHLRAWMAQHIDPEQPVVMPFVWTVTNLSLQAPEFFFLVPTSVTAEQRANAVQAIQITVGPHAVLREATHELLIDALRASAAIPVAFDPVKLPSADGTRTYLYVDGGVTANTPVGVARAAARRIDVVLLDPPYQAPTYQSAIDIGVGVFGAMQRRILESDLRAAYLESYAKTAIASVRAHAGVLATLFRFDTSQVDQLERALFETQIYQVQPKSELAVSVVGFNDRTNLFKTFETGFDDARTGFVPYVFGED